ncbi:WW domain-binding protein 4, partial [Phenoliferia sp. Uapishka_3]
MSEYWVSKDKYFCKYCNIFIADDKPSRALHETGLRHKGNYERFIRDIYKRGARNEKDKAEESRELERIEAAANAAMQADGFASTSSSSTSTSVPPPRRAAPPPPSSSDPYANYSTAASLGYIDTEVDKAILETTARQSEGTIGEWQRVIKPKQAFVPKLPEGSVKTEEEPKPVQEEEEEPERRPGNGYLREKTLQLSEELEYDPSKVAIKLKRKRLTLKEEEALREEEEEKARVKKEEERRERKERKKAGYGKSGWAEDIDVKEEEMLMFETKEEEVPQGVEGAEEGVEGVEGVDEKPDVKPVVVAGPTFKKRKGGAAARGRSKV